MIMIKIVIMIMIIIIPHVEQVSIIAKKVSEQKCQDQDQDGLIITKHFSPFQRKPLSLVTKAPACWEILAEL